MKLLFVVLTGLLWMVVFTEAIPLNAGKKNHKLKFVDNKDDNASVVINEGGENLPETASSMLHQKKKTTKRMFKAKINYSGDDVVPPLRNKVSQRKQNRTLDLSDIDEVLPDRIVKKYRDFVKDGYGKNVEELTNVRRKLKILKKIHGNDKSSASVASTKISETTSDVDDLLFQGDERLSEAQLDSIIESTARHYGVDIEPLEKYGIKNRRPKRQAVSDPENLWPQFPISYYFDTDIPANTKKIIKQVFANIKNQTCLSFEENSAATSRIQFANRGIRCASLVGFTFDGPHKIDIGPCITDFGVISHEVLHVLGIHHQQDRSDVLDYLEDTGDLDILDDTNSDNFGVPYDYGSVMHYADLTTKDPLHHLTIGQRIGPSFTDIALLNRRYNCLCENPTVTCLNGGYPNPFDCGSCLCPRGYDSSKRCSGVDPSTERESEEISVASNECQIFEKSLGNDDDTEHFYYKKAWFQFKAPTGKRVQLIFLKGANIDEYEQGGCRDNGIEVKITKSKFDRSGYLFCGNSDKFVSKSNDDIKTFTSSGNMAMLQLFSKKNMVDLIVKYRYVDSVNDEIPYSCLPSTSESDCENIAGDEDCELYAENPDEDCEGDPIFMLKNCAKTCGVC